MTTRSDCDNMKMQIQTKQEKNEGVRKGSFLIHLRKTPEHTGRRKGGFMMSDRRNAKNDRNVFQAVKEEIRTDDAARHYGIKIGKGGMACCPFHNDKDPSMKIDRRFHCFGCGADGDVIDFIARFFKISSLDAALRLAEDFGISYKKQLEPEKRFRRRIPDKRSPRGSPPDRRTITERCLATQARFFHVLADYYHLLNSWKEAEAPSGPEDQWSDHFCEALMELSMVEFLMDEILEGTPEKKIDLMNCYKGRVKEYERRLDKYTTGQNEGI